MKTYKVKTEWSGYSRGTAEYLVVANSKKEAKAVRYEGKLLSYDTVRNDTKDKVLSVEEVDDGINS
ncbi:MAG: hypothetical protein GY861_26455 [bacterium]|nr:hypothetical protein [bacterium]